MSIEEDTFILLDNGSEDNLMEEVGSLKEKRGWTVIKSKNNLGFGGGVSFASKFVKKDYVAWMPGNLKLDPRDVYKLIEKQNLDDRYIYLKARRTARPLMDSIKTIIFGILVSSYFNKFIYDAGGTPNLIHKDFFSISNNFPNDFSFDVFVYFYCLKNNFNIVRPKIRYTVRRHGESHWQKGLSSEINLTLKVFKAKKLWSEISKLKY